MDNTDLKQQLGALTDMVYALSEQFDVIREAAYDAVNEGTDDPEVILMRIKALAHIGGVAAEDLQEWLNDLNLKLPREEAEASAPRWIWSGDQLPPTGEPVLVLDDPTRPEQIETATRGSDWEGVRCWWMRIPPVTGSHGECA